MSAIKGDFIGFSFGGQHCSNFNIVRVSDGSRYNESLLPSYQDTIQPRVGADGSYYWNGFYTQKMFSISFAFDSMTETNFREMRQWLGQKGLFPLIFDEAPYKQWMARARDPQLNFICFDEKDVEGNIVRIYKGEGSVQFVAPYPFATGVVKSKEDVYNSISNTDQTTTQVPKEKFPNANEWINSVGLPNTTPSFTPNTGDENTSSIHLTNCGDLPMDFTLNFIANSSTVKIELDDFILTVPCTADKEYEVNTATRLIYKMDGTGKTLEAQNEVKGEFFKIPVGTCDLTITGATPNNDSNSQNLNIDYSYLFY